MQYIHLRFLIHDDSSYKTFISSLTSWVVSLRWGDHWFHVFVEPHFSNDSFFEKTIRSTGLYVNSKCKIMAEGFRFMPLGLVRLITFRLSAWVSKVQTWAHVSTRVWSGRVTRRCHNRNPRWETGLGNANDVTHRKRAEDLGDFDKVSLVEFCLGRRRLAFTKGAEILYRHWVPHVLGGRWKSQNRKNVYLSPYIEEPLNSKLIKKVSYLN